MDFSELGPLGGLAESGIMNDHEGGPTNEWAGHIQRMRPCFGGGPMRVPGAEERSSIGKKAPMMGRLDRRIARLIAEAQGSVLYDHDKGIGENPPNLRESYGIGLESQAA